jgi:hypothetical protein
MMKSMILTLTAALGLTMSAHANIGDGTQTAINRWGNPTATVPLSNGGVRISYITRTNWFVRQFYNANGVAVGVIYYKPGSDDNKTDFITKSERDGLWLANTMGEGANAHWEYVSTSTSQSTMWYSKECQVTIDVTTVLIGKAWVSCMIFATDDGLKLMAGSDQQSTIPVDPSMQQVSN